MRNWRLWATVFACAASLAILSPAKSASPIGNTVQASTTVSASGRVLEKSSPVFFNDIVRTNGTGIGAFVFDDGARLAVGPSATVTIDKAIYKGGKSIQQASIQASKGAFRYISGAFSGHKINTPYGTIGIRGTAFDFTIKNGRVYILLFRGAVSFCSGGSCKTLKSSCDYLVGGGGKVSDPQGLSAGVDKGLNVGEVFPLLVNQGRLNSQFRQGTRNCFSRAARRTPNLNSISPKAKALAAKADAPQPPGTPDPGPGTDDDDDGEHHHPGKDHDEDEEGDHQGSHHGDHQGDHDGEHNGDHDADHQGEHDD